MEVLDTKAHLRGRAQFPCRGRRYVSRVSVLHTLLLSISLQRNCLSDHFPAAYRCPSRDLNGFSTIGLQHMTISCLKLTRTVISANNANSQLPVRMLPRSTFFAFRRSSRVLCAGSKISCRSSTLWTCSPSE